MLAKVTGDPQRRAKAIITGIITIGTAVLLVMWAVLAGSIINARDAATARLRSEGRNLAVAFEDEATHILDGISRAMELVAERMRDEGGRFDVYAWGREAPMLSWGMIHATIIGPDGKVTSTTLEPSTAPIDLSDREHFRVHLDGRFHGLFIGKPVVGRVWRQPMIPVTRRVDAEDGSLLGVLVFMIAPGSLASLHKSFELGERDTVSLTGLDHIIRARFSRDSPDGIKDFGKSLAGDPRPSVIPENGDGSYIRASLLDGYERLYSYRRIGAYPLVVTVGLDRQAAYAVVNANALMMGAMIGVATLLLAALAVYLVREIGIRTAREIELAEERSKYRSAARAKSDFLATMSHEIRSPMNGVIGIVDLLRDTPLGGEQKQMVDLVHDSAASLLRILDDVLDFSKIEAGAFEIAMEPTALVRLATSVREAIAFAASAKGLSVEIELGPDLPEYIATDPLRLRQILVNLLSNAVKFTHDGWVRLSVSRSAVGDGRAMLAFSVIDTGIGISPDQVARLFQPFTQADASTSRNFGGTGLGLSISRRLAGLLGGELQVSSEPGCGSVFTLQLPLVPAERPVDPGEGDPPVASRIMFDHARVLVAEDMPTNRWVIRHQLERLGLRVELVEDGPAALRALAADRYDLLVTDVHMPGMDGIAVTSHIRDAEAAAVQGRLPIIGLTADITSDMHDRCLAAGMDAVVSKPTKLKQLEAVLGRFLAGAQRPPEPSATQLVAEAPDFDAGIYRELFDDGDPEAREWLDGFIAAAEGLLAQLRHAAAAVDRAGLAAGAHRLASAALSAGATRLGEACRTIETVAPNAQPIEVDALIVTVTEALHRARVEISRLGGAVAEPIR